MELAGAFERENNDDDKNLNFVEVDINLEKEIGHYAGHGLDVVVALNGRYRFDPHFEPGIEWRSEFGTFGAGSNSFDEQAHGIGPSAFGNITKNIKY